MVGGEGIHFIHPYYTCMNEDETKVEGVEPETQVPEVPVPPPGAGTVDGPSIEAEAPVNGTQEEAV